MLASFYPLQPIEYIEFLRLFKKRAHATMMTGQKQEHDGMQTQIEIDKKEKSPMLERIAKLKPRFSSNQEAVDFYSKRLETIASSFQLSIEELLNKAENSDVHNDDYIEALACAKRIVTQKR